MMTTDLLGIQQVEVPQEKVQNLAEAEGTCLAEGTSLAEAEGTWLDESTSLAEVLHPHSPEEGQGRGELIPVVGILYPSSDIVTKYKKCVIVIQEALLAYQLLVKN